MKSFYYEKDGKQFGPIQIENIHDIQIKPSTLIWFEGLSNWKPAKDIPEFGSYLKSLPPPLPLPNEIEINKKFDLSYKKETMFFFIGILLLLTPISFYRIIITGIEFLFFEDRTEAFAFFIHNEIWLNVIVVVIFIPIRICSSLLLKTIAKRQNRNTKTWATLGFFFPSICMMILGLSRKLQDNNWTIRKESQDLKQANTSNKNGNVYLWVILLFIVFNIIFFSTSLVLEYLSVIDHF